MRDGGTIRATLTNAEHVFLSQRDSTITEWQEQHSDNTPGFRICEAPIHKELPAQSSQSAEFREHTRAPRILLETSESWRLSANNSDRSPSHCPFRKVWREGSRLTWSEESRDRLRPYVAARVRAVLRDESLAAEIQTWDAQALMVFMWDRWNDLFRTNCRSSNAV